jgi:hypothetical protein
VFEVDGATTNVTLRGLTITGGGGVAQGFGGGYYVWNGVASANDGLGGGILNFGTLTLSGCKVSENTADSPFHVGNICGGGIYNAGTLTLSDGSIVSDNSAANDGYNEPGSGGGIYNAGTLTVKSGSTVSDNSAYTGGGICNAYKATATFWGSTLSGNYATYGGGIDNIGTLIVSGCTLTDNTATSQGGGIYNARPGHLTITSSVLVSNVAPLGADLDDLGASKISKDSTIGVMGP